MGRLMWWSVPARRCLHRSKIPVLSLLTRNMRPPTNRIRCRATTLERLLRIWHVCADVPWFWDPRRLRWKALFAAIKRVGAKPRGYGYRCPSGREMRCYLKLRLLIWRHSLETEVGRSSRHRLSVLLKKRFSVARRPCFC